jgi:hypothetical protein
MTPQERQIIDGIFERLKSVETQPRDPEAERYIAERVARQPYATYALAQAAYVQEEAVRELTARIRELEDQVGARGGAPTQGGFLDTLFGGREQGPPQTPRTSVPQAGAGTAPQYGTAQPGSVPPGQGAPQQGSMFGGGGFLSGALGAAAGLAGGALLYQGLKGMFGQDGERHGAVGGGDTGAPPFGDPDHFRNASLEEDAGPDADFDLGGDDFG